METFSKAKKAMIPVVLATAILSGCGNRTEKDIEMALGGVEVSTQKRQAAIERLNKEIVELSNDLSSNKKLRALENKHNKKALEVGKNVNDKTCTNEYLVDSLDHARWGAGAHFSARCAMFYMAGESTDDGLKKFWLDNNCTHEAMIDIPIEKHEEFIKACDGRLVPYHSWNRPLF